MAVVVAEFAVVVVTAVDGAGAESISGATLVGVGVVWLADAGCDVAMLPATFCITACAD